MNISNILEVAVEVKLKWEDGPKVLLEAIKMHEEKNVVIVAARSGITWSYCMEEIVREYPQELTKRDEHSGLYPFMVVAAAGSKADITTLFNILRLHPQLVRRFQ